MEEKSLGRRREASPWAKKLLKPPVTMGSTPGPPSSLGADFDESCAPNYFKTSMFSLVRCRTFINLISRRGSSRGVGSYLTPGLLARARPFKTGVSINPQQSGARRFVTAGVIVKKNNNKGWEIKLCALRSSEIGAFRWRDPEPQQKQSGTCLMIYPYSIFFTVLLNMLIRV